MTNDTALIGTLPIGLEIHDARPPNASSERARDGAYEGPLRRPRI